MVDQPRQHFLHQQSAHLARHAGEQHGNPAARVLDPQPRRGAARIGQDGRPLGQLRLGAVDGGHRPSEPLESGLDPRQQRVVHHQPFAEQFRDDGLRHVVAGGAETSGRQHEPGALECFGHGRADRLRPIGDGDAADDFGARRSQGAAQLGGVRVHGVPEQQLRADGDDFELHPLSSAR